MFQVAFHSLASTKVDLFPKDMENDQAQMSRYIYENVVDVVAPVSSPCCK